MNRQHTTEDLQMTKNIKCLAFKSHQGNLSYNKILSTTDWFKKKKNLPRYYLLLARVWRMGPFMECELKESFITAIKIKNPHNF